MTHATRITKSPLRRTLVKRPRAKTKKWLSGNITFVSNYVSYGMSSSNNLPALQGQINFDLPKGFFINLWGSNAIIGGWKQSMEFYPNIGWSFENSKWQGYIFAAYDTYFFRPTDLDPSYFEFEGALGYTFKYLTLILGMNFSPQFYLDSGLFYYPSITFNIPLVHQITLNLQYAYAAIEKNDIYGVPNYSAFQVGLSKNNIYKHFGAGIYFYDTTVKASECFPATPGVSPSVNECGPGGYVSLVYQW